MRLAKAEKLLRDDGAWLVKRLPTELHLIRTFNDKAVTVRLCRSSKGYELLFPSYLFGSCVSHFSPTIDEIRFCRNKQMLFSLVRFLKRTGIWNEVENKNFIKINRKNKHSDKDELTQELRELIGY